MTESRQIPYAACTCLPDGPVLVLAPHPDDEVFGCGGAILTHRAAGQSVHVVILTDGGHGGDAAYCALRQRESRAAAEILGYGEPEFWGLPDRKLEYGERLIQQLQYLMADQEAKVIYAPSVWEVHPDHVALAHAALEAVRRQGEGILLLYEVGAPLRPNLLLDLTPHWARKQAAMRCFASQLAKQAYDVHIAALNRYRTYTLPAQVAAAEAFHQVEAGTLVQQGFRVGPAEFAASALSNLLPDGQAPLVSVIVRSMARPTLGEALESVALQTYAPIEVVLVNALGAEHPVLSPWCGRFPLRQVGNGKPLQRAAAANVGLQAARGEYLLLLDDDDTLDPPHLTALVAALRHQRRYKAAYAGVRAVSVTGTALGPVWHQDYDPVWLKYTNYLPIHAVLFHRSLLVQGCAFDEQFSLYEDWDFWLQIAECTHLLRVDQISAAYRAGGDSQGGAVRDDAARREDQVREQRTRAQLYDKWRSRWQGEAWNALLWRLDRQEELGALQAEGSRLRTRTQECLSALELSQQQAQQAQQQCQNMFQLHQQQLILDQQQRAQLQEEHDFQLNEFRQTSAVQQARNEALQAQLEAHQRRGVELERQLQHVWAKLDEMVHSVSWQMTRPYRWLGLRLKRLFPARIGAAVATLSRASGAAIRCQIEQPDPAQAEVVGMLLLQGWVHAPGGIRHLVPRIDGQLYPEIIPMLERPDVNALFGTMPGDGAAGFSQRFDLHGWVAGTHTLSLELVTADGQSRQETLNFWLADSDEFYARWLDRRKATPGQLAQQRQVAGQLATPAAEVTVWLADGADAAVETTLMSLAAQSYPYWRLCGLNMALERLTTLAVQAGIAPAQIDSNAVPSDTGWSLYLEAGETLDPRLMAAALLDPTPAGVEVWLFDHDRLASSTGLAQPVFAPDWSPQFLLGYNYAGGVFLCLNRCLQRLGIDTPQVSPAWRYDLLLRLSEVVTVIRRVPQVLWHAPPASAGAARAETEAVRAALIRRGWAATVTELSTPGLRRLDYALPEPRPLVSIIIPTTGKLTHLKPCIESLLGKSSYQPFELVLLDNGRGQYPEGIAYLRQQKLTVIERKEAFNWSRLNNVGAAAAQGELLLFLNDDVEITQADWLEALVSLALRPEVGAVGALLLYPNELIQHAGVFLVDHGGGARHIFQGQTVGDGYQHWDSLSREISAVTGACLLVRRALFDAVGGFDENLPIVGNDVDFCLKLRQQGYFNLYTPNARLIHHESISRKKLRIEHDEVRFWQRWGDVLRQGDPYFSPNLAQDRTDCALAPDAPAPAATEGVNLIAYIRAEMGVGQGARNLASCLQAAEVPLAVVNFEAGNPARMSDLSWQVYEVPAVQARFAVNVLHVNADHTPFAISQLPPELFAGHYTIGYWMWELPEFPDRWQGSFDHVQEIWVGSSFVQQAIATKSPVPVIRIPHAIALDLRGAPGRAHFGLPPHAFLFLSMYDTHSIVQRKNPQGAILAFQRAFDPEDGRVGLVIKVSNPRAEEMRELHALLGNYRNIHVLEGTFSRSELNGLINACDCFVSLHRAEGFGLGPAEAMSLGKVALLTAWSGSTDYMRLDNCAAVDYRLVTLGQDFGPYQAYQQWAEPDLASAVTWMRRLLDEPGLAQRLGERARATIAAEFSPLVVGQLARRRLQVIYARLAAGRGV